MHDALGDALAVEVGELLDEMVVLEQDGPAFTHGERGHVVVHGRARVGGPVLRVVRRGRHDLRGRRRWCGALCGGGCRFASRGLIQTQHTARTARDGPCTAIQHVVSHFADADVRRRAGRAACSARRPEWAFRSPSPWRAHGHSPRSLRARTEHVSGSMHTQCARDSLSRAASAACRKTNRANCVSRARYPRTLARARHVVRIAHTRDQSCAIDRLQSRSKPRSDVERCQRPGKRPGGRTRRRHLERRTQRQHLVLHTL